jgi:RNA polymerase sigma factor (TIGR02999 family)
LSDVTRILESIEHGDPKAADRLLPLVYEELRKLAASKMANELPNQTLQPTALVHEAWLRLVGETNPNFSGRAHFFGAAAEAMRRILIDKARRKHAVRHGGDQQRVDIEVVDIAGPGNQATHAALALAPIVKTLVIIIHSGRNHITDTIRHFPKQKNRLPPYIDVRHPLGSPGVYCCEFLDRPVAA